MLTLKHVSCAIAGFVGGAIFSHLGVADMLFRAVLRADKTEMARNNVKAEEEEADVCCICLEPLPQRLQKPSEEGVFLACCGNRLHVLCHNRLDASQHVNCPMCRCPLPTTEEDEFSQLSDAAQRGSARAMYNLANFFEEGRVVEKSMNKAIYWLKMAVEREYVPAQHRLGLMFQKRAGISGNERAVEELDALLWFRRAATNGYVESQMCLGSIYGEQSGWCDFARDQALFWYKKAAEQGDSRAQEALAAMVVVRL